MVKITGNGIGAGATKPDSLAFQSIENLDARAPAQETGVVPKPSNDDQLLQQASNGSLTSTALQLASNANNGNAQSSTALTVSPAPLPRENTMAMVVRSNPNEQKKDVESNEVEIPSEGVRKVWGARYDRSLPCTLQL
jgi:hypothetical protein